MRRRSVIDAPYPDTQRMQYTGRLSGMENERNVRNNRFAADRSGTLGKSQLRAGGKKVGTMTTDTDISNGGGDLHSLAGAVRGPDLTNPSYRTGTYQLLLQRPFDGGSPQQFLVRRRRPVITQVSSLSSDPDRSDLRTRFLDATIPSVLPTIRTTPATTVTRVNYHSNRPHDISGNDIFNYRVRV